MGIWTQVTRPPHGETVGRWTTATISWDLVRKVAQKWVRPVHSQIRWMWSVSHLVSLSWLFPPPLQSMARNYCTLVLMLALLPKKTREKSFLKYYAACVDPRLVPLSKALYHTCFIFGQRCKWWSCRLKWTLSAISDVKPIIYIYKSPTLYSASHVTC